MADKIASVQTISASSGADIGVIELPKGDDHYSYNAYGSTGHQDSVIYIFDGSNANDIELVQESNDTEGIKIPASTRYQSGPWRIHATPPKYLYGDPGGNVRVTVVVVR